VPLAPEEEEDMKKNALLEGSLTKTQEVQTSATK
jgi:hypothetical protein